MNFWLLLLEATLVGCSATAPLLTAGLPVHFTAGVMGNVTRLPSSKLGTTYLEDTLIYLGVNNILFAFSLPIMTFFFDTDDIVRFYAWLPSMEILNDCFRAHLLICHMANTVAQQILRAHYCTYELRLNAPLQDLEYQFVVSLSTVSRIFSH